MGSGKNWTNVTAYQIAQEIYGHAAVFYNFGGLTKLIPDGQGGNIYSHLADGVDIENKVDRYQSVWNTIWIGFPPAS